MKPYAAPKMFILRTQGENPWSRGVEWLREAKPFKAALGVPAEKAGFPMTNLEMGLDLPDKEFHIAVNLDGSANPPGIDAQKRGRG